MAISEDLPGITAKISAVLATKPQLFITHPAELRILKLMTKDEMDKFAAEHCWSVVRRVGCRQIEFYNDVSARSRELT
jgi:hypothetical protein